MYSIKDYLFTGLELPIHCVLYLITYNRNNKVLEIVCLDYKQRLEHIKHESA